MTLIFSPSSLIFSAPNDLLQKKSKCLPAFAADASGYAGELQWSLENGNLTISDVGKMEDYAPGTAPWYAHKDDITSITISYGVESIGDYAFYGIDALEGISIPDSVKYMGVGIFDGCSSFNLSAGEGSCAASKLAQNNGMKLLG